MKSWRSVGIVALVVIGLTATNAFAGSQSSPPERGWLRTATKNTPPPSPSASASFGKWAALVLLLGLGGFAVYKRRGLTRKPKLAGVSSMRIVSMTRLSAKAQVVALEVQGRTLLLGATDTQITRLGWLDEEAEQGDFATDDGDPDNPKDRFEVHSPPTHTAARKPPNFAIDRAKMSPSKPSRFRELLADAIGLGPKGNSVKSRVEPAPVDELVAAAEDRYVGREPQRIQTQRMRRESTQTAALINVEGQAKGLVARLNRPQT